jgi:hypothetical protein
MLGDIVLRLNGLRKQCFVISLNVMNKDGAICWALRRNVAKIYREMARL